MKRQIDAHLIQWKNRKTRKPLVLQGARQVGKTYSVKAFGAAQFPKTHYLNFEEDEQLAAFFRKDLKPHRIIEELRFHLNTPIHVDTDLVIFDEIQASPEAVTSIKYFCEQLPELALIAAGSLLGVRLGGGSFPVGKVEFLEMYPLSFEEFLLGIGETPLAEYLAASKKGEDILASAHLRLWELLKIYFVVGGLPEQVQTYKDMQDEGKSLFETIHEVRARQHDLILAYNADMAKHSGKTNSVHIERVWRNVTAQLAREQNGSAPKFRFQDVIPGVRRYEALAGPIDWLTAAGLIIKVPIVRTCALPLSAHTKENTFKLYFFDVGILGAMSNLSPKAVLYYDYGTYKGYFAENFVAQEFVCSGAQDLYSWTEGHAEVEFLREVDGHVLPVEVKSGWVTHSKSLKVFSEKYHPDYVTIMSAQPLKITPQLHKYPLYLASRFPLTL